MKNDEKRHDEETLPKAKRTGREGVDPEALPGEYADDMRVNRFTPPPEPEAKERGVSESEESNTRDSRTAD